MDTDRATLEALARGVALQSGLTVEDGEPGGGWTIDVRARRIWADPLDRERLPAAQVHGLTCHEAAHAAVTRYPWLVPPALLEEDGVAVLLNAVEDCRIETWTLRRLPGTRPWITAYNDRLFPADGGRLPTLPPFLQFALAVVHRWWHERLPDGLDARVVGALERTREAVERAVAAQPPTQAGPPDPAYPRSRLPTVFQDHGPVSGFEQGIRLAAARSWAIVWRDVLPTYRALVALTPTDIRARLDRAERQRTGSTWRPGRPGSGEARRPDRAIAAAVVSPAPTTRWERARQEVLPQVDRLVRELEAMWRPTTRVRWSGATATGQRVDLRQVMAREARPEQVRIWQRKSLPDRREPWFLLALDLSGSMAGPPIEAAFRGTVLLAEALARLQIPFALHGFQDVPLLFKDADTPLAEARPALDDLPLEVVGCRPGGHNRPQHNWDGPVLDALVEGLTGVPGDPVVIMVSDGAPSGPSPAEQRLHQAIARVPRGTTLIGVGLGADAAAVADVYPHAVRCSLDDFPATLARCLQDALHAR